MNCGGFGTEAFFLLVLSYTKTRIENVAALIIAVGSSGFAISGNRAETASHLIRISILPGSLNGQIQINFVPSSNSKSYKNTEIYQRKDWWLNLSRIVFWPRLFFYLLFSFSFYVNALLDSAQKSSTEHTLCGLKYSFCKTFSKFCVERTFCVSLLPVATTNY